MGSALSLLSVGAYLMKATCLVSTTELEAGPLTLVMSRAGLVMVSKGLPDHKSLGRFTVLPNCIALPPITNVACALIRKSIPKVRLSTTSFRTINDN